jgi:hypothetical protein
LDEDFEWARSFSRLAVVAFAYNEVKQSQNQINCMTNNGFQMVLEFQYFS